MTTKTKSKTTKSASPIKEEEITRMPSQIAASTREFVKRSAATAKERAENLHEGTEKFNSSLENGMTRFVGGYVSVLGGIAEATFANVDHALTTVEKLAGAQSVSEAVRIQSDYVRESTTNNMNRARDAANIAREMVVENTSSMRDQFAKAWPYGQKAA